MKKRTAKVLAWNLYTIIVMAIGFAFGMLTAVGLGILDGLR